MLLDLRLLLDAVPAPPTPPATGGESDDGSAVMWMRRPRVAPVFAIDPAVMTALWASGQVTDEELIAWLDDGGVRTHLLPGSRILKHRDSV